MTPLEGQDDQDQLKLYPVLTEGLHYVPEGLVYHVFTWLAHLQRKEHKEHKEHKEQEHKA